MDIYHAASLIGLAVGASFPAILVPFFVRRWYTASIASGILTAVATTLLVAMPQLRLSPAIDAVVVVGTAVLMGLVFGLAAHGSWQSRGQRDRGGWSSTKPREVQ